MSEKPEESGRWQAGDSAWYPPGQQPEAQIAPAAEVARTLGSIPTTEPAPTTNPATAEIHPNPIPIPVPDLPEHPTWSGKSDRRPEAGPMYPDLFSQAMAGSSLANVVAVDYAEGEARPDFDVVLGSGGTGGQHDGNQILESASARVPAEVGAFLGASAKKRRRIRR